MAFYSTVSDVQQHTGIRISDLGFDTDAELVTWVEGRLTEIKDLIDHDRNRDYTVDGSIPAGIHNIALRIMSNMVAMAVLRRETPIVRVDDFNIKMVEDRIFTTAIKDDLKRYPKKPAFRLMRARNQTEIEEAV